MNEIFVSIPKKPDTKISIRNISLTDTNARHDFFWKLTENQEGVINTLDELDAHTLATKEKITDFIRNKRGLWLIALLDDKIIGEIDLTLYEAKRLSHVASLTLGILKDFQGLGLGSLLMECALAWAYEHSLERIELSVFKSNIKAINLYKKFGFIIEGEKKNFIKNGPHSYDNDLLMALML